MTWYENPALSAVFGGLAGAIATGLVSIYIWRRTHKVKRVDCIINDVSSLLTFSDKIKDQLDVKFSGKQAKAVYLISMDIINSGTDAIESQPVQIRLAAGATIVDYTIVTEPEVGFGDVAEKHKRGNELDIEIELLNPDDRVALEIVSLDNSSQEIDVYMKNANVQSRVYSRTSAERAIVGAFSDRQMLLLAALSAMPFFGGFARSMMTIALAQRIDRISK